MLFYFILSQPIRLEHFWRISVDYMLCVNMPALHQQLLVLVSAVRIDSAVSLSLLSSD